ncbi:MAG: glutamate-1-semialdehyde 2,1-aminomutase [Thermoanaerobaculia bacterium]
MANQSEELFQKAQNLIPGGVNSPVRAFKAVGGKPLFIKQGQGSKIVDIDDRAYIDYCMGWGALLLGHCHPFVQDTLKKTIVKGTLFGTPTQGEVELAEAITQAFPSIEKVRLVSTGTEAVMSAIRLARAYTGRDKILKFDGCYHGHYDPLLVKSGSGVLTLSLPNSPGITKDTAKDTIIIPYNDINSLEIAKAKFGKEVAAVIVEPVMGNAGVIPPEENFLQILKEFCNITGSLLIFDEIITGFRLSYGGAQEYFNIKADLTTLGKICGGGLPLAAFGGRKEIMDLLAPEGPVYQAGTFSGNPVSVQAGLATLKVLKNSQVYKELEEKGEALEKGIKESASKYEIPVCLNRIGSMFTIFFTKEKVIDLKSASTSNTKIFSRFFNLMLENGIYLSPSQFEGQFISLSHSTKEIEETLEGVEKSFKTIARELELGPYK